MTTGRAGVLPFLSQLRVYEPLESFPEAERRLIEACAVRDGGDPEAGRDEVERAETQASLQRVVAPSGDPFPTGETEFVRTLRIQGRELHCPSQLVVRTSRAAQSLSGMIPRSLSELLLPADALERHQERVDRLAASGDAAKVNTQESLWGVPFSWFALFQESDPAEIVEEGDRIRTVRLRTGWDKALARARFAVANLALAAPDMALLDELTSLTEWLEGFHPESVLELDYGTVAERVFPDDSPLDLRLGIECLAEGDMTGAAAAYRRLASRWIPIRQLARAS